MPPVKSFGERIADALIEDGLLTAKQVEELMDRQKKEGTRFIKLVLEQAYVSEQDMTVSVGRVLNVPPINLARISIPSEVADLLPREVAQNHKVVPVSRLEKKLFLAMADPLNVLAMDDVKRITRLEIAPMIASEKSITDKLNNLQSAKSGSMEDIIQDAQKKGQEEDQDSENVETVKEVAEEVNLDQLAASSGEAPVIKLANIILVQAIKDRASDVHIEPYEKVLRLRYRVDGVLSDAMPPPKQMQLALASRFKIMSSLDIAERRLPQDGRMRVRVGGKDYDLRVSIMPTVHGEKIVLRVLDKSNLSASIDKLGLDADTFQQFKAGVDAPHGLILVTGPTGSGKTTTLYSALNELNNPIYNIITVEDPVEFQLPGINQVPVKKEIGLSFANALRSILRQDPDIIMIGEMRDSVSFQAAISAADTGHLVLSTIHTTNAATSVGRILDFFQPEERDTIRRQLSSTLRAVICQRMVTSIDGKVTPAQEIMVNSPVVRKMIEENRLEKLPAAIETARDDGMQSFNQALYDLVKAGRISKEAALEKATNGQALEMMFQGIFLTSGNRILG